MRRTCSGGRPFLLHWSLVFLAAGAGGLVLGFVLGLAEPRRRAS